MPEQRTIAVTGATGAQGGGLVRAILADPRREFAVRAVTRRPDSEKARALAAAGAEVVQADLDDEASLARAFAGAYGAYCVTNYWEHFSPERELAQAANLAHAARGARVQHVIWSTLEDVRRFVPLDSDRMPTLRGKWKVPHFDAKGEADHFFRDADVPTTFFLPSFYWDNFIHFGSGPQRMPDGSLALVFCLDDKAMAGIAAADIGKCAYGIFRAGQEYVGSTVGVAGGHLTGAEMAAALTAALGRPIGYQAVTPDVYRALGFPGADDLGNMFQFYRDFEDYFRRSRDVALARTLNPELQRFDAWLAAHAAEIPIP